MCSRLLTSRNLSFELPLFTLLTSDESYDVGHVKMHAAKVDIEESIRCCQAAHRVLIEESNVK